MILREQDKHFLASIYAAVAIIFAWKGLWEGLYEIPYIGDPFVFLFIGFAMLTFSGLIFQEFDPLGNIQKTSSRMLSKVQRHPRKKEFTIKYYDKKRKKHLRIPAEKIKKIEKGALIVKHPGKREEVFIPMHRVTEILHKGKKYWRL